MWVNDFNVWVLLVLTWWRFWGGLRRPYGAGRYGSTRSRYLWSHLREIRERNIIRNFRNDNTTPKESDKNAIKFYQYKFMAAERRRPSPHAIKAEGEREFLLLTFPKNRTLNKIKSRAAKPAEGTTGATRGKINTSQHMWRGNREKRIKGALFHPSRESATLRNITLIIQCCFVILPPSFPFRRMSSIELPTPSSFQSNSLSLKAMMARPHWK